MTRRKNFRSGNAPGARNMPGPPPAWEPPPESHTPPGAHSTQRRASQLGDGCSRLSSNVQYIHIVILSEAKDLCILHACAGEMHRSFASLRVTTQAQCPN